METYNQVYDYNRYRRENWKASKYTLKDEILHWNDRRWRVDDEQKEKIFESCHSGRLSGHFGRDKTRDKICSRFFWPGMYQEISDKIARFDICQINKKNSELHSIPVKPEVWCIDYIGPLTETPRGNRYIIRCSDYFSKWPGADALKSKDADGVVMFLYKVITRHGVAEMVMSDEAANLSTR